MIKKIIAFALSLCLVLGCPVVNAADVLTGLGIDSISVGEDYVSRAAFSEAVAKILSGQRTLLPQNGIFADVTEKDSFSGSVYFIYNMGLISGYGNSTFGPNDSILAEQAVKILVSALGYDVLALSKGGYPVGYMAVAHSVGLLDGLVIESGKNLDGYTAGVLLENAIECEVLIQTGYGDNASYSTIEGRTLLTEYMNLKKISGILTDNGYTSLTGPTSVGEGMVIVNGQRLKVGLTNASLMLGGKVDAYVSDDGQDKKTIKYISYSDECTITKISAKNLMLSDSRFSITNIVYTDIYGKERTARLTPDCDYIYNGKAYPDFVISDLNFTCGEIVLIDNDGNGKNDVLLVKEAITFVLDAINRDTETLYGKNGSTPISLKDKDNVIIVKDGNVSDYASLVQWDVLSVYKSLDEQYIEIDVSSFTTEGTVTEKTSIGTVSLEGEYFNVLTDTLMADISVGSSYCFCIDAYGNIAAIKSTDSDTSLVSYFMDAAAKSGMDSCLSVRLYTLSGEFKEFDFADNADIDGYTLADTTSINRLSVTDACAYLKTNANKSLVSYKLNSKGLIKCIKLPLLENEYEFDDETVTDLRIDYKHTAQSGIQYRSEQLSFAGKINMTGSTPVFVIPNDSTDEYNYNVISVSDIVRNEYYFPVAYSIGAPNGLSEYIIYPGSVSYKESDVVMLISKISSVIDSNGETVMKASGVSQYGDASYLTRDANTILSLNPGDIVRCHIDSKGKLGDYQLLFDYNPETESGSIVDANNPNASSYASSFRLVYANVFSRYGDLVGLVNGAPSESIVKSDVENQLLTGAPLYEFDYNGRENLRKVETDSVNDYKRMGNAYSKIFIYTRNAGVELAVVYK